jgi:hypothetical protein
MGDDPWIKMCVMVYGRLSKPGTFKVTANVEMCNSGKELVGIREAEWLFKLFQEDNKW